MKTFILLTKLTPGLMKQVKFLHHYALLGKYDFLDICEAPDEETAAKVSLISLSNGAFQSESLVAIPYAKFVELTKEI